MKEKIIIRMLLLALCCSAAVMCGKDGPVNPDDPSDIRPEKGATIYGQVANLGKGVEGVVVSDGVTTVVTDRNGVYQLHSAKKNGLVFVSIPSGYTVNAKNNLPQFYQFTEKGPQEAERLDFQLYRDGDQTAFTMVMMGDIHIFENNSKTLFTKFIEEEINPLVRSGVLIKPYFITLGDMTWDYFWYKNGVRTQWDISLYQSLLAKGDGLKVFHTVGNHDHDMKDENGNWANYKKEFTDTREDFSAQNYYRRMHGPTCYSFNIGQVHFISIDDVITIDDGTGNTDGRGCYRGITDSDLGWLKSDLSHVSKDTPLIVAMHIPIFAYDKSNYTYSALTVNGTQEALVAPFAGYSKVIFVDAHTHDVYNNSASVGGCRFEEWNNGSVCGNFWGSANPSRSNINIAPSGSPGGYRVVSVNGKEIRSEYKATGRKEPHYFFRSYDRNCIKLDPSNSRSGNWGKEDKNNYVYLNVWDYKDGWDISVTENGYLLNVEKVKENDPLYIQSYIDGATTTVPHTTYLYRVKAGSPTSTLLIRVTDESGNTHSETMTRPKAFSIAAYRN